MLSRLAAILSAVLIALTVNGCSATPESSGRSPDPGGELLRVLKEAKAAVPPNATVKRADASEPHPDKCTPSGAKGYSPATVNVTFTTSLSRKDITLQVGRALLAQGWHSAATPNQPFRWQKRVAKQTATTTLVWANAQADTEWLIFATAPSELQPRPC